ncbi:MAG: 3'(2'),5'-bisphosphate nucleotidase CysQ [Candidatus Neomarinimicrobiota bacterium]
MDNLTLSKNAARAAGKLILDYYNSEFEVRSKGFNNPVTTADKAADDYLKNTLTLARPRFGWLSEETLDSKTRLTRDWVWVVDPLDGTKEFIAGIPNFVVSIGLVHKGSPVLGVLYNPVTAEMFSAEAGKGAFLNDKAINCKSKLRLQDMTILNSRSETGRGLWNAFKNDFKYLRPVGSVAYKMGLTAAGQADIFATLRPKNEWDICAGTCIIIEAGGKVIDLNGDDLIFNQKSTLITPGLIAGAPQSVDKVFELLRGE